MGAVFVIELRRLNRAPVEVRGEIASDDPLWAGTGVQLVLPLRVHLTAEGSPARGVWVRGTMSCRIRAACRRCLESVEPEIVEQFEWLFDVKTSEAEGDLTLYSLDPRADELDLRPALRERLLLSLPAFPVCREDCAGLCPRCGKRLSEDRCECSPAEIDPRWGPLQALRGAE
jgi:uncharacterized protein